MEFITRSYLSRSTLCAKFRMIEIRWYWRHRASASESWQRRDPFRQVKRRTHLKETYDWRKHVLKPNSPTLVELEKCFVTIRTSLLEETCIKTTCRGRHPCTRNRHDHLQIASLPSFSDWVPSDCSREPKLRFDFPRRTLSVPTWGCNAGCEPSANRGSRQKTPGDLQAFVFGAQRFFLSATRKKQSTKDVLLRMEGTPDGPVQAV